VGEYAQMGVVPRGYNDHRYDYAEEWVQVLKRLWTESSVTHHGEYFDLDECVQNRSQCKAGSISRVRGLL